MVRRAALAARRARPPTASNRSRTLPDDPPVALLDVTALLVTRSVCPLERIRLEPPDEGRVQRTVAARVGVWRQRATHLAAGDPNEVDGERLGAGRRRLDGGRLCRA